MQLSSPSTISYQEQDHQKELCPGHIIQGNPSLQAVVNTSNHHPAVFFEHEEVVTYCNNYCPTVASCTEIHKKAIADIFRSYGKKVISFSIPEHIM